MERATDLLQVALQYYYPDGRVPPYNLETLHQEVVELEGSNAEEYAFHFFVTFIRRLYPDTAQEHHVAATIPLLEKVLTSTK
jgi:hypothetical protein